MNFQAPKGVSEYVPPRSAIFEYVRDQLCAPAKSADYQYMELPVFEDTALFQRGVGESTDIVTKEMYTFEDRGGRSITLRPEGTAGVMRAVIEHGLDRGQLPVKVLYQGAYFRAERPQKGRYRQFYQVGIEAIGLEDPLIDAEVIWLAAQAFKNLGLKNFRLEITSLGDADSRAKHRVELLKFYETLNLDEVTAERAKVNPLRLFDDKRPEMVKAMDQAPKLLDFLNERSRNHFELVKKYLDSLNVEYVINPKLVRGFDYYTGTTFEFIHTGLGAQSAIGGGGRYDKLMSELGGQDLSGIGWGIGVDRTILAAEEEGVIPTDLGNPDLFIIPLGTQIRALEVATELRNSGKIIEIAFGERALKGAMKAADKSRAKFVIVLGDNEVTSGSVDLKNMATGESKSVRINDLKSAL